MRYGVLFGVLSVFFLCSIPARAETMDGNTIFGRCTSDIPVERAFCFGYTTGLWEGFETGATQVLAVLEARSDAERDILVKGSLQICVPAGISREQIQDIFTLYLKNNPEKRHVSARILMLAALRDIFPCRR